MVWHAIPKDLLKYIFKYLEPILLNSPLILYMTKKEIIYVLDKIDLESCIDNKLYILCKYYLKYKAHTISDNQIRIYTTRALSENLTKLIINNPHLKHKVDYTRFFLYQTFSSSFIKELIQIDFIKEQIDWNNIAYCPNLSEDFIIEFQDKLSFYIISREQTLSEDFIIKFQDKVNWSHISQYQKLSEDFIWEFRDKLHWKKISEYQILSNTFIRKCATYVNWIKIFVYQELSMYFIEECVNTLLSYIGYIEIIIRYQKVSKEFILKYIHEVSIEHVLEYQELDEEFIIYLIENDYITEDYHWDLLYQYQKLSNEFIEIFIDTFIERMSVFDIIKYQKLPKDILKIIINSSIVPTSIKYIDDSETTDYNSDASTISINMFRHIKIINYIIEYQILSDDFIKELLKDGFLECSMNKLCVYQQLTESFINEYIDEFNIEDILYFQNVSGQFLEQYMNNTNYVEIISQHQSLSKDFVRKHQNRLNLKLVFDYHEYPKEFIEEFSDALRWRNIKII